VGPITHGCPESLHAVEQSRPELVQLAVGLVAVTVGEQVAEYAVALSVMTDPDVEPHRLSGIGVHVPSGGGLTLMVSRPPSANAQVEVPHAWSGWNVAVMVHVSPDRPHVQSQVPISVPVRSRFKSFDWYPVGQVGVVSAEDEVQNSAGPVQPTGTGAAHV
jgi:hypothetical protein